MTAAAKDSEQVAFATLQRSGLPLQTLIPHLIRQVPHCELEGEEFAWRDEDGANQFTDLVISKGTDYFPIECKKTESTLTFLNPGSLEDSSELRMLFLPPQHEVETRHHQLPPLQSGVARASPRSLQATLCAASDSGPNQMLEKQVRVLLGGTDAWAQHLRQSEHQEERHPSIHRCFIPLLVTTARLYQCDYEPADVPAETGVMPTDTIRSGLREVSWVRFRKQFTADGGDRTAIVVRADQLTSFLTKFDLGSVPLFDYTAEMHHLNRR